VDGEYIFATGQFGDLVCVYAADGKEVWRKNMAKDFGGEMMSGWGYAESPLVDGSLLICTPGGKKGTLVALDKATGELKWRTGDFTDKAAYSSPVPVDHWRDSPVHPIDGQECFRRGRENRKDPLEGAAHRRNSGDSDPGLSRQLCLCHVGIRCGLQWIQN